MKKIVKTSLITLASIVVCGILATSIYFGINFSINKVNVANFHSYMNPELIKDITKNNNVDMKYFATAEECEREFTRNYDVAIDSSYSVMKLIRENKVAEINWQSISNGIVQDADDALKLFTSDIQQYFKSFDLNGDGLNDNLLKWSIPYFVQSMVIAYKSEQPIIENSNPKDLQQSNQSFKKLIDYLEKEQFNGIAFEDFRSLFSLSMVYSEQTNINVYENKSVDFFKEKYSALFSRFNNNRLIFNTDPATVINNFVQPYGRDFAIMFNGDLLWALQGGDELNEEVTQEEFDYSQIHFFEPYNSPKALDLLIINKEKYDKKSQEEKNNIHDIARKMTLDGVNSSDSFDDSKWAFKNFDFIYYTTPYQAIYDYVINEDFFPDEKFINVFKISNAIKETFEENLSNLNKRNLIAAFFEIKNSLG